MLTKTLAAVALCAAALTAGASAQGGKVRARPKGRRSIVVKGLGRAFTLNLTEQVDAARIEGASVLFASGGGEFKYLLLRVCGPSKARPDDRQCGAGVECNLVWLKLNARRRLADAKSERYESCWAPVTADEGPTVEGRRLRLVYDDLRENLRHTVTYDADRPEEGLKSETEPLPEQGR